MPVTVELRHDLAEAVKAMARRRGQTPEAFMTECVRKDFQRRGPARKERQRFTLSFTDSQDQIIERITRIFGVDLRAVVGTAVELQVMRMMPRFILKGGAQ